MGLPRINAHIAEDLTWYWNCAEGEVGVPSNFSAMVAAISLGQRPTGGKASTELDEHLFYAARRLRRIARALERITAFDRGVLFAAFGPHAHELPALGRAAPVAPLTMRARQAHRGSHTTRSIEDWLVRLTYRVSNQLGDDLAADRANAQAIAFEATHMLAASMKAFTATLDAPEKYQAGGHLQTALPRVRAQKNRAQSFNEDPPRSFPRASAPGKQPIGARENCRPFEPFRPDPA
ncbi:MAG: hypothetical protein QM765_07760 [Myxococcales bacterium]